MVGEIELEFDEMLSLETASDKACNVFSLSPGHRGGERNPALTPLLELTNEIFDKMENHSSLLPADEKAYKVVELELKNSSGMPNIYLAYARLKKSQEKNLVSISLQELAPFRAISSVISQSKRSRNSSVRKLLDYESKELERGLTEVVNTVAPVTDLHSCLNRAVSIMDPHIVSSIKLHVRQFPTVLIKMPTQKLLQIIISLLIHAADHVGISGRIEIDFISEKQTNSDKLSSILKVSATQFFTGPKDFEPIDLFLFCKNLPPRQHVTLCDADYGTPLSLPAAIREAKDQETEIRIEKPSESKLDISLYLKLGNIVSR